MNTKEQEAMMNDPSVQPAGSPSGPPPAYPAQPQYPGQPGYTYVQQPGAPGGPQQPVMVVVAPPMTNMPPDNMMFNVIVTIFCCWPIGIFAILKSMACRDAINRGDRQSAADLSAQAKKLGYWTLGVGIACIVLSVILIVVVYAVWLIPMWSGLRRD